MSTEKYKGYTIKIEQDECFESPRDYCDNLGTMTCWHSRYNLGDEQPKRTPSEWQEDLAQFLDPTVEDRIYHWTDGNGWVHLVNTCQDPCAASDANEQEVIAKALDKHIAVMLPLYLYDHGNIAMSTSRGYPFNCPWDSGQVGWIFVTKEDIRREYSVQRISKKTLAKATRVLQAEVEEYNQYLQGDVWYYSTEKDGEFQDGCGGFYGYDYCLSEAQAVINHIVS